MKAHPVIWLTRALWLVLPFTAGDAIGAALASRSPAVAAVGTGLAWVGWAVGAVALAVAHPLALTALRLLAPAAAVVAGWAAITIDEVGAVAVLGLVAAVLAAVGVCSGWTADHHVDGTSYGDERRFSLRAPGPVVVAGIPLAWVVAFVGIGAGPLLLAARSWAPGAAALVIGVALAVGALRSLHTLATRFVVFVPAGMTLVDPTSLVDSVLFARSAVLSVGPAPADGEHLDLSQAALGLALEVVTRQPTELTVRHGRKQAEDTAARAVVFTPARPAAVLAEAARRRMGAAAV